jgi:hypothetical protein
MKPPRDTLTENVLNALPPDHKVDLKTAKLTWWQNPTKHGGYRLSSQGFQVFAKILDIQHWTIRLPNVNIKLLQTLDKKVPSPYYIDVKKKEVKMFGSKEAMMASLHGDVERWLALLQVRSDI